MFKTENDLIHIGKPLRFDIEVFLSQLANLMDCAYNNRSNIKELVQEIVETYHPAS